MLARDAAALAKPPWRRSEVQWVNATDRRIGETIEGADHRSHHRIVQWYLLKMCRVLGLRIAIIGGAIRWTEMVPAIETSRR